VLGLPHQELELGLGVFRVLAEPVEDAVDRAGALVVARRPVELGDTAGYVAWLPAKKIESPSTACGHSSLHSSSGSVLPKPRKTDVTSGRVRHF
jgi:hypothetical protein